MTLTPSARELEIGRFVCEGYTTNEIAQMLTLSSATIHAHRTSLRTKLRARNTSELMNAMLKHKLWVPPE